MTEHDHLRTLTRAVVENAEHRVDVEHDLALLRERIDGSRSRGLSTGGRRAPFMVAACVVLLAVVATVVLLRVDRSTRTITPSSSESTVINTVEQSAVSTTVTTDVPGPTSFELLPPIGGTAKVGADTPLQGSELMTAAVVPFDGVISAWGLVEPGALWVGDGATGGIVVFDTAGSVTTSFGIPTTIDDRALSSIAVGPGPIAYGLYVGRAATGDAVTIAAYRAEGGDPVRTFYFDQTVCEEGCFLRQVEGGLAFEGSVVPYVDELGEEQSVPTAPAFATTDWSASGGGDVPDTVVVRWPAPTAGAEPALGWALAIEGVVFDSELGQAFLRQADGSLLGVVRLALAPGESGSGHDVLLRLVDDAGVAAIDLGAIPGFVGAAVDADGRLVGVARTADGLAVGPLVPASPTG